MELLYGLINVILANVMFQKNLYHVSKGLCIIL